MDFLDEKTFNAAFGKRLRWVRDEMDLSRPAFGKRLGITKDQLKRYETRDDSAFPLYLLPPLIHHTFEPYAYWVGEVPSQYWGKRSKDVLVEFRKSPNAKTSKSAIPKR